MPVISVVALKGGVGKTTIALSLAAEFRVRGFSVLLADADPQGSSLAWGSAATDTAKAKIPSPTVVGVRDGFYRPDQLPKLAASYDWTIIDTPPHAGPILRASLAVADLAILPCGPGALDAWALGDTVKIIEEARRARPGLKAVIVLNRVQKRTAIGLGAREALTDAGIPATAAWLGFRVTFAEAVAAGLGPTTYQPKGPAADEVRALCDETMALCGIKKTRRRGK
jgi:chromosome partitioning protein